MHQALDSMIIMITECNHYEPWRCAAPSNLLGNRAERAKCLENAPEEERLYALPFPARTSIVLVGSIGMKVAALAQLAPQRLSLGKAFAWVGRDSDAPSAVEAASSETAPMGSLVQRW